MDAHFRDRRIDEEEASKGEERDAADSEHAMSGKFGFRSKKCERAKNEAQRGKAHRQQIQGKECEQDKDNAHGAGNHRAGMIEFGIKRKRADSEQDERDVGIHQIVEDLFLQRHAKSYDRLAGEIHSGLLAVEALEGFALHLAEKIVRAGCDVVDQVLRQGFLVGEGFRFAHGAFGELDVAAAPGNDRAHQSGGIVLDLLLHFVIGLDRGRAEEQHGMRRSSVGAGSHGRDVGGFENEDSRRTGAAAAGRHINDDGNLR